MRRSLKTALQFLDWNRAVFVIVGFGLTLRIIALALLSDYSLRSDALSYHTMALQLLRGEDFIPHWPPGLPCYLASAYYLLGAEEWIGRASIIVFYIMLSGFLYALAGEVFNRKAGNLCLLFFTIYPTHVHQSVEPLTQLPAAASLTAVAYLVIRMGRQQTWGTALPLGLLLGWITLLRPSGLLLIVFVFAYILRRTKKRWFALAPLAVSLTIVSLWVFRVYQVTERFVMINYANSQNLFYGNNAHTPLYKTWWFGSHKRGAIDVPQEFSDLLDAIRANPREVQDRLYRRYSLEHILSRPGLFLLRTANRIRTYFAFDTYSGSFFLNKYHLSKWFSLTIMGADALFYCSVMAAAVFSIFGLMRTSAKPEDMTVIVGMTIVYALPYWVSFSHPTYHFPVVPLLGVFAAAGIVNLIDTPDTLWAEPVSLSRKRRLGLTAALILFVYIQVEWVVVMRSFV